MGKHNADIELIRSEEEQKERDWSKCEWAAHNKQDTEVRMSCAQLSGTTTGSVRTNEIRYSSRGHKLPRPCLIGRLYMIGDHCAPRQDGAIGEHEDEKHGQNACECDAFA